MAMLSEVDSWNFSPIRLAAITAGASCGDIEMALAMPTFSTWGTSRFAAAVKATQMRMIGTARRRIVRGTNVCELVAVRAHAALSRQKAWASRPSA